MAFTASAPSGDIGNSFSIGPKKVQYMTISAASGDTSGTVTATRLSRIDLILVNGLTLTADATYSGNVATLAFVDPAATVKGTVTCIGV
jgi:hypothetical protein